MHAGTACSHCMREGDSGFRFQNAERQRHAAVVTQGETGPQAVRGHPPCAAARKAVFRSAAFQPDGLDLAEGERPCKAGACRLEEGFLRGKIRRRAGGSVGSFSYTGWVYSFCSCTVHKRVEVFKALNSQIRNKYL